MDERFSRTEMLIGRAALELLARSRVAVFGIGGVGSYAVEALARGGVGRLVLIDHDTVSVTNINRQLHALSSSVGSPKVEVMKQRVLEINPEAEVTCLRKFYLPGAEGFAWDYDYVIDAVDTVTAKLGIITQAKLRGIPVISAMGAGNKLDPGAFRVDDIYGTSVCPLARVMRRELRKRNIDALKVVYSAEEPLTPAGCAGDGRGGTPGSVSFVPPVVGLMMAGEVIKDLIGR